MRLVTAGHDYALIENTWTLKMVMDANEAYDIQEEANSQAMDEARSNKEEV